MTDDTGFLSHPVRIAYLDSTGEMGGSEHLLLSLLAGLPQAAIESVLVCTQEGLFPEKARKSGVRTLVIPLPKLRPVSLVISRRKIINPMAIILNIFSVVISVYRIVRCLKTEQIDLIQTNSAFSHIYGGIAARFLGLPCVWYFHDLIEVHRLRGTFVFVWRSLAAVLATHVVGVSEAALRPLAVGSRGRVIYAGHKPIDKGFVSPSLRSKLNLSDDVRLVGYVGRIAYVKGLDVLVEAAQQIVSADQNIHFVLLGDALFGESGPKRTLERTIKTTQLVNHWHWLGYDEQAVARMLEMDLVVLPSRRESLGLVLVEAGMMGKPVVASRVGGIPEVVVDGETGILVSPERPDELASAILHLVQNPELASEIGRQAHKRVNSVFGLERYYAEFWDFYESLLRD